MDNAAAKIIVPPRGRQFENQTIFTERFVEMYGDIYYMRTFHSGSTEFSRYDETIQKWVYLCFP